MEREMEAFIVTLLLIGVAVVLFNDRPAPATPAVPYSATSLGLAKTVTVFASTPSELGAEIEKVRRDNTNRMYRTNYIVGAPHINPDGLSAHVPLFNAPE